MRNIELIRSLQIALNNFNSVKIDETDRKKTVITFNAENNDAFEVILRLSSTTVDLFLAGFGIGLKSDITINGSMMVGNYEVYEKEDLKAISNYLKQIKDCQRTMSRVLVSDTYDRYFK